MNNALGTIEAKGLVASIETTDRMVKAADVTLTGQEKIGNGLVAVVIRGDVDAIKAAVDAGVRAAESVGEVVSSCIIPRPHKEAEKILPGSNSDAE